LSGAGRPGDQAHGQSTTRVIALTRAWIERAVIGLNLCPFARAPYSRGRIHYRVSEAIDCEELLQDLRAELDRLVEISGDEIETTLLIHPDVLNDFFDYNGFLDRVDITLRRLNLEGVIQVASFHPQYQFAGTSPGDLGNATNQSPFPMLHLLREDSIDRALAVLDEPESIFEANIASLERLGEQGWRALQAQCQADADSIDPRPLPKSGG
jgi:uncharacterized protein